MELKEIVHLSFECTLDSPGSWYFSAWRLKRAAEEIDTFTLLGRGFSNQQAKGRDAELQFLTPVYRFLLGQAFENLLKGIIIAHGKPAGSNGKLLESFRKHEIKSLLEKLDPSQCTLTSEEQAILFDLQQYVEWAGRYPIPTKADTHQIVLGYSSEQHRKELELWERLSQHLRDIGWFKKDHGKIFLRDHGSKVETQKDEA